MSSHPVSPAALGAAPRASLVPAQARRRAPAALITRRQALVCLMLCVSAALVATALAVLPSAATPAAQGEDATLLTLIRGMALIKATLALAASGALAWRFGRPASVAVVAAYLGGVWLMVLGSVVVWQCVHVGWAALLFHSGELTVLLTAWRDGGRLKASARR